MGGFCSTLQYRHVVDPATYTVNEVDKRIQKKQGQKTAEQLAMQNGRFADEPERQRERLEKRLGPQDEGKWGHTREMLAKAQNISQFAKHLHLTKHQMHDALSQFQALDADGNGVIDKREFASILNMDPDCERTTYMFNALDVDRNGQLNYKEFMVVASHFNSDITEQDKARFCFKMVDANNDGVVSYEELKTFLLDIMYSGSSAKHRMVGKIDSLITKQLEMSTYDRLKEQDFVELVAAHKDTFTPMLAMYSKLHKVFSHSFDPSSTKHTNQEVSKYFHAEDGGHDGGDATEDIEYSSASAQAAARRSQKPNFQHEFQGQGQKKKATADLWERDGYNTSSRSKDKTSRGSGGGKADAFAAVYGAWGGNEPPKLQRKISQDDSLHDYDGGGGKRRGSTHSGSRVSGRNVDIRAPITSNIDAGARVGGLMGRAAEQAPHLGRHISEAPLGSSLDEEDFASFVQKHHAAPSRKKEKGRVPVAPMMKFGR